MGLKKSDLAFLPLGGSGEIGMNVNLYHHKGQWLMIDLGAGFADDRHPGVDMLAPDVSFIAERKDKLVGILLTHAHEDHVGSIPYVWGQLQCPIYATPFTAAFVREKLKETSFANQVEIHEIEPGQEIDIGPFKCHLIQITHSIPEMNGVMLKTEYGNILHTGDWKFDPDPVVGDVSDQKTLKKYGDEGVMAMVCDSTNVFNDRFSGSEGELQPYLEEIFNEATGMIAVTTFASNVARLYTIAKAAKACGKRVAITGRSLFRIDMIARETGYFHDIDPFLTDEEIKRQKREDLVVVCTGCQGEQQAAMYKIIHRKHRHVHLKPKDTVVFSSKIIPGNEKTLFHMFNDLVHLGAEVYTEKDHKVHVSGHPSREELRAMYELVRPDVAIPVHGEAAHLHEHCKLARSLGVPDTVEIQNGQMIRLAPEGPKTLEYTQYGYLGVDGYMLQPVDGPVLTTRKYMQNDGALFVSVALNRSGRLAATPELTPMGLIDEVEEEEYLENLVAEIEGMIDAQDKTNEQAVIKTLKKYLRKTIKEHLGKFPVIRIHVLHVS